MSVSSPGKNRRGRVLEAEGTACVKAEGRVGAGMEAPLGIPHSPLPAQTWAESSYENFGGWPRVPHPLPRTGGEGVLSKCAGVSV